MNKWAPHKCPICEGRGVVPGGFYSATTDCWSWNTTQETCRQCGGTGIIWADENGPLFVNYGNIYDKNMERKDEI